MKLGSHETMADRITYSEVSLIEACRTGDQAKVQQLLTQRASGNVRYVAGCSPLVHASGHTEVATILLSNGAQLDSRDKDGWTPLTASSYNGHVNVVQFLLDHGATIQAKDKQGRSPLHHASEQGHPDVVDCLLSCKADIETKDDKGFSPLHLASKEGHPNIVEYLLSRGADKEARAINGYSPLHLASREGHPNIVKYLLSNGADKEARANNGWSPLHHASYRGHPEVVKGLLSHGADLEVRDNTGQRPLHYASRWAYPDVMDCLLSYKADIEARDKTGWSPLHHASRWGHQNIVDCLLSHGADIEARDNDGLTPIVHASWRGHDEVVDFLVRQGARLDVRDNLVLKYAGGLAYDADGVKKDVIQSLVTKPELNFKGDDTSMAWSAQEKMSLVQTCNTRLFTAGELMCGKTSLARSIISTTQYRTYEVDRTVVVEKRHWQVGNQTIPIVDLGGHKSYRVTGMFFLANASNNVVLLCHDVLSDRYILTYHWIKDIICHAPEAHILPVLTTTDTLPPGKTLEDYIKAFADAITKLLQHDIKSLELKCHLAKRVATKNKMEGVLKCYQNLNNQFEKRIITVSAAPMKGKTIEYLKEKITEYSSLPENQVEIPEVYQHFYQRIGCIGTKGEENEKEDVSAKEAKDVSAEQEKYVSAKEEKYLSAEQEKYVSAKKEKDVSAEPEEDVTADNPDPSFVDVSKLQLNKVIDDGTNLSYVRPKQMLVFTKLQRFANLVKSKPKQNNTSFQPFIKIKPEEAEENPAVSTPAASTHPSMPSKLSAEIKAEQQSYPSLPLKKVVEGSSDQASSVIKTDLPYLSFADAKAIFEETERELNPGLPVQHDVRKCLTTLHNLGLIMAFSGTNKLEQFVFNNHSTIIAILKAIFHHETDNFLEYDKVEAKYQALFEGKKATFQLHRNMLNTQGIMTKAIKQTLLRLNGCEIDEDFVTDLIVTLKVGYKFVEAENKGENLFIPYYIEDSIISPDIIAEIQPAKIFEDGNVALNMKIVGNITQTYFNRTILHIYQMLPSPTSHTIMKVWGQGLYYRFGSEKIIVCYDGCEEIKLQIAGQPKILPKMWERIKEIHDGMEGLRHEWTPGMIDQFTLTCICEQMPTSSTHEHCYMNLEDVLSKPAPDVFYCETTGQKIPAALVTPLVEGSSDCEKMVKEVEDFMNGQTLQKKDEWEILALQTMHPDPVINKLFSKCVLSLEEKMDLENLGIFAKTELLLKTIKKKARHSDLIEALKETRYHTNVDLYLFMTGKCDKGKFLTADDTDSIKRNFSQTFLDGVSPADLRDFLIEELIMDFDHVEDFEIRQTTRKKADYLLNYLLLRGTVQTVQGFHRAIIASNQPHIASYLERAVPHICKH